MKTLQRQRVVNTRSPLWDTADAALADADDDQVRVARVRVLVFQPFDRVILLSFLGLMGVILAVFATPLPVRIAGVVFALVAFPLAIRFFLRDLHNPRHQRGLEVTVTRLPDRGGPAPVDVWSE